MSSRVTLLLVKSGRRRVAYRELADELRAAILKKGMQDGGRLPTEFDLVAKHNLSRQTVRRAYQDLVNEGIVERIPGRGTFANPPGQYVRSLGSLDDLLAQSVDTEMEVVQALGLVRVPHGNAVSQLASKEVMEVRIRRIHDNLPFSVVVVSVPADIGKRLGRVALINRKGGRHKITVLEILDRVLDPPIIKAKQIVTVDRVPRNIAELIDCKPGRPVLRIDRLFIDGNQRPVELAVNYFNPDRYAYRLELKRSSQ